MARKASAKVVLARGALDRVELGLANGIEEVCRTIVEVAHPPDATPYGEGLVTRGGWLVYVDGKKVAGGGLDGKQPKKPRAWRPPAGTIQAIVGFGFPARFQHFGTIHHPPQTFLPQAVDAVVLSIPGIMRHASGLN